MCGCGMGVQVCALSVRGLSHVRKTVPTLAATIAKEVARYGLI